MIWAILRRMKHGEREETGDETEKWRWVRGLFVKKIKGPEKRDEPVPVQGRWDTRVRGGQKWRLEDKLRKMEV